MKKNQIRYRKTVRLQSWDYRNEGLYFITICAKKNKYFFGEIKDGSMQLNDIGSFAEKFWMEIPKHFSFIELANFVVMPNHVHGVLNINKLLIDSDDIISPKVCVPEKTTNGGLNERWKSGSIGVIINQYKRIVTINARKINPNFGWHPRFYDHIIRSSTSFERIQNYIENNPINWNKDKFR